jgi:hypothetical protein
MFVHFRELVLDEMTGSKRFGRGILSSPSSSILRHSVETYSKHDSSMI